MNKDKLIDIIVNKTEYQKNQVEKCLDEIFDIMKRAPMYGSSHWVTIDVKQWIDWMDKQKPGQLLKQDELKKLELQVSRWLSDFRRELQNL